jgi:hypothetical protein
MASPDTIHTRIASGDQWPGSVWVPLSVSYTDRLVDGLPTVVLVEFPPCQVSRIEGRVAGQGPVTFPQVAGACPPAPHVRVTYRWQSDLVAGILALGEGVPAYSYSLV